MYFFSLFSFPIRRPSCSRLHAHREYRGRPKAPGFSPRGSAGLWGLPASRGPSASRQASNDPASAPSDRHQGRSALLQHQNAGQSPHAQTIPGDVGGQGLTPGPDLWQTAAIPNGRRGAAQRKITVVVPIDKDRMELGLLSHFNTFKW